MAAFSVTVDRTAQFTEYLDRAVDEVFRTMMAVSSTPVEQTFVPARKAISAVLGLAGAISGSMVLHSGARAAMRMAERLTGIVPAQLDAMVRDAVGEVCNMLAGTWKGFDPILCAGCLLSTPTVVAGSSYELFSQRAPMRIERSYRFEDFTFTVTIFCEME
jgi:chemotaxis protein CheX